MFAKNMEFLTWEGPRKSPLPFWKGWTLLLIAAFCFDHQKRWSNFKIKLYLKFSNDCSRNNIGFYLFIKVLGGCSFLWLINPCICLFGFFVGGVVLRLGLSSFLFCFLVGGSLFCFLLSCSVLSSVGDPPQYLSHSE